MPGFFSKDEILFRTYASGHTLLWAVGLLTALLTATYMFRLVFMTFTGLRAASAPQAPIVPPIRTEFARGHLLDAPSCMAVALLWRSARMPLGWAGIGGRFEHFLEPSFGGRSGVRGGACSKAAPGDDADDRVGGGGARRHRHRGVFLLANRAASDRMAEQFSGVHRVLLNKYYVDEIYDAAIVQPIHIVSEDGLWKGVDVGVIDRAVNGVGRRSAAAVTCCAASRPARCARTPRRCFWAWC